MQLPKNEAGLQRGDENAARNTGGAPDIPNMEPLSNVDAVNVPLRYAHLYPPVEALYKQQQVWRRSRRQMRMTLVWIYVALVLLLLFRGSGWEFVRLPWWWAVVVSVVMPAVVLALVVLGFWVNIVAHEVGHMLTGMACGMKLLLLSVGRWRFERTVNGFRWRKAQPVRGVSGVAVMTLDAKRHQRLSRWGWIFYIFGGAGTNLLLGAGVMVLIATMGPHPVIKGALIAFGLSALFLGVLNLLPLKVQGWCTDGRLMMDALMGKDDAVMQALLYLSGLHLAGTRPRDWPRERIPDEAVAHDAMLPIQVRMSVQLARLEYALDAADIEQAQGPAAWLATHFDQMPDGLRQQVALGMATCSSWQRSIRCA